MTVKLHASSSGAGSPVILLHGLFGSAANLGALARSLRDRFEVHSLDLPDHGRSGWLEAANLASMAGAVRAWMDHHGLQSALFVGHSLGGKVAMQLALDEPRRVAALVVADIAPVAYPPRHDAVFAALEAVAASRCGSRQAAAEIMAGFLAEPEVVQFLLASLQRGSDGGYGWRFNLDGIRRSYPALRAAPGPAGPYPGPVLFIKGGDSDYIQAAHRVRLRACSRRRQ